MQDNQRRQLSDLVSNRLPEFVRVDHPTLVAFLEAYYEWLQVSDRGGKLLNPMSLGDVIDIDDTMDQFITQFKREYLFNFPEKLAISDVTGKPVDVRKLIKNIKAFYRAKGTEKSYEFLFRILYDTNVEFYYPKRDILRVSDGKWFEKNSLKLTNTLGSKIFDSIGRVIYQRNSQGEITASAKVTEVNTYQESIYEVAELNIIGRNGTFARNKPVSFDTEEGTLTELQIYSVVSTVSVTDGGSGYEVGDKVTFTSASQDTGINARGAVSLVSASGAIRRIRLESFGINYSQSPTITVQSFLGSGFSGTANIGSLCQAEGYYLNYDGRLSTNKVLQDNHYYQDYSYVLRTEMVIDKYRESIRRLVHPAGTAMFGQVLIKRCAKEEINNTSALIRYEVPVIGHYTPYTFLTYDNLQDWFTYFAEGDSPAASGLTPAGYDPTLHESLIVNASIAGNPISSGVPFVPSLPSDTGGFLGLPMDSVPDYSIPLSSIPDRDDTGPLGELGYKNSYPFWFIYEHPNRRITEPTIAQIWKNQIVDSLDFGWQWGEHCSVTGGLGPTGWTADFYGDNPVEKKYAFLKYDQTSAFRKITARAFFEMPLGVPFDCRSVDIENLSSPVVSFASPKSGQAITTENGRLPIEIVYENEENNRFLPPYQKAKDILVTINGAEAAVINFGATSFAIGNISSGLNKIVLIPRNQDSLPSLGYAKTEAVIRVTNNQTG